jgi:hypothetical protein
MTVIRGITMNKKKIPKDARCGPLPVFEIGVGAFGAGGELLLLRLAHPLSFINVHRFYSAHTGTTDYGTTPALNRLATLGSASFSHSLLPVPVPSSSPALAIWKLEKERES